MYAWDVMIAVRRRWKIVMCGLLLTAAAAFLATIAVPRVYQATGSVLFIAPADTGAPPNDPIKTVNPYLNFSSPLAATAAAVNASVNSSSTATRLSSEGATGTYRVAPLDVNGAAPLMSIEATAGTAAQAVTTVNIVLADIQRDLADIQQRASAPTSQFIHAQTVIVSDQAPRLHGSLIRALVAITIIGVILSCAAAGAAQTASRKRQPTATRAEYPTSETD